MTQYVRFRRLAGAACLLTAPALLLIGFAVIPWQKSDGDALDTLTLTGANVTASQWGDLLVLIGILAMIPAALTVMHALRRRAPLAGLIGGSLIVVGHIGAMLMIVNDQINIGLAEQAGSRAQSAVALEGSSAWVLNVVLVLFLGGLFIGGIVLGAGLLRSRIVPVWAGVAMIVSPVISIVAHAADRRSIDVVGSLLIVVAFAAVAQRVVATSDEDWDADRVGEVARRAEGRQVIPA